MGEDQSGLIYALTHLHPAAYFILFLIFLLALVNLVAQGSVPVEFGLSLRFLQLLGKFDKTVFKTSKTQSVRRNKRISAPIGSGGGGLRLSDPESTILGVRKRSNRDESGAGRDAPTPLDGINHPMPHFVSRTAPQPVVRRVSEAVSEEQLRTERFKPHSTVELISPEESERREKEQLVVSGFITDSEGKGVESVIVYLTDEAGNRQGQSCRSQPGTGEFWVRASQPGKYVLHAYKRGHQVQNPESLKLASESGKIEGVNLRMIEEQCAVTGKVLDESHGGPVSDVEIRCICKAGPYSSSSRTDASGRFYFTGVPINAECELEVLDADNTVLARSEVFQTIQKGEIHRDIIISKPSEAPMEMVPETVHRLAPRQGENAGEPSPETFHQPATET